MTRGVACLSLAIAAAWGAVSHAAAGASKISEARLTGITSRVNARNASLVIEASVPVPYVVAIVDLPEGVSVRCNLIDVAPDPDAIGFGMPVEMTTGVSQQDKQGNDVVAFYFRPAK